jgi:hypothetical protein
MGIAQNYRSVVLFSRNVVRDSVVTHSFRNVFTARASSESRVWQGMNAMQVSAVSRYCKNATTYPVSIVSHADSIIPVLPVFPAVKLKRNAIQIHESRTNLAIRLRLAAPISRAGTVNASRPLIAANVIHIQHNVITLKIVLNIAS